jgi:hypothetical protein
MALPDAPDGLSKARLIEWIELEIASNLYDATDLKALQDKLLATRDIPEALPKEEQATE